MTSGTGRVNVTECAVCHEYRARLNTGKQSSHSHPAATPAVVQVKTDETVTLCVHCLLFFEEGKTIKTNNDAIINEHIRDREVRVIGADGAQLGIMPTDEARRLAEEAELDLVLVSPNAQPPVCKIIDYGKFKYEQTRRDKEAKKKQKTVEIKEIRMSPNIDTNDLETKISAARKFLSRGDRVKVTLRFRGREMAHMNQSAHILTDFANALADIAVVDKTPKVEGRSMSLFLAQKK